jgi:hypothetical protein
MDLYQLSRIPGCSSAITESSSSSVTMCPKKWWTVVETVAEHAPETSGQFRFQHQKGWTGVEYVIVPQMLKHPRGHLPLVRR